MSGRLDLLIRLIERLKQKAQADAQELTTLSEEIRSIADALFAESQTLTFDQGLDVAFANYVAGYYSRAYVVISAVTFPYSIASPQKWLSLLMKKQFRPLEHEVHVVLADDHYTDDGIRSQLETDTLVRRLPNDMPFEDEIVNRVLTRTVAVCFEDFLAFAKQGDMTRLNHALSQSHKGETLAVKVRDVRWWWWLVCLQYLMKEFADNSLWLRLEPMRYGEGDEIVVNYIKSNYRRNNPVVELWRSQNESLESINDPERRSFCLRMPTGAGKTRVAELAIVRFLIDHQSELDTKCIYIAPFRALASEVEKILTGSFEHVSNAKISQFYGRNEIDLLDQSEAAEARVLIATPEKIDGLMRQQPSLLSQIRLVIADEGHLIGDQTDRGQKYQLLLHRLIYVLKLRRERFERQGARLFFISGVLPQVEEFANWLLGDRRNTIISTWRPIEEPQIGRLEWNGGISLIRSDDEPTIILPSTSRETIFGQPDSEEIKFAQVVARAAVAYAQLRPTMLFSASKRQIRHDLLLSEIETIVQRDWPLEYPLPAYCPRISDYSRYYSLLERGVAVHHAGLPPTLRQLIEQRIYNGQVRLVLASPTLAQGVNLPIHTVLVYGLEHRRGKSINAMTFWNVVGRIGRPLQSIFHNKSTVAPPEVLFILDKTSHFSRDEAISRELIKSRNTIRVNSAILDFLTEVRRVWERRMGGAPIAELVSCLAENDLSWIGNEEEQRLIRDWLYKVDAHLREISREARLRPGEVEDCLQSITADLMHLFQGTSEVDDDRLNYIREAVKARARFLARIPEAQRDRDYLLGLPEEDCRRIQHCQDDLLTWYQATQNLFTGDLEVGLQSLAEIMDFAANLSIARGKSNQSEEGDEDDEANLMTTLPLFGTSDFALKTDPRKEMFKAWVRGDSLFEVAKHFQALDKRANWDAYRQNILEERLPWGLSAISRYISDLASERGVALRHAIGYLPSLVKYGVPSPLACRLVRLGFSRAGALKIEQLLIEKLKSTSIAGLDLGELDSLAWTSELVVDTLATLTESDFDNRELDFGDRETLAQIRQRVVQSSP